MNKEKIGTYIKTMREKAGLTQTDLANRLLTSRENISKWERGIALPSTEYLKELCSILNCNIVDLLNAGDDHKDVNLLIYELMDKHMKFVKNVVYTIASIVVMFTLGFLLFYFFQNYNTIKLYKFSGESGDYRINNSIMFMNKERCYFVFNGFLAPSGEEIKHIIVYYDDISNDENIIYKSDENPTLVIYNVKKLNINKIIDGLYVQIVTDKNVINIKLDIRVEYSNTLDYEYDYVYSELSDKKDLPSFVDDNFKFNYKENSYEYEYMEGEIKVNIKYDINTKNLTIYEKKDEIERMILYLKNNVNYVLYSDENDKWYNFDLNYNICISNECPEEIVKDAKRMIEKYKKYFEK